MHLRRDAGIHAQRIDGGIVTALIKPADRFHIDVTTRGIVAGVDCAAAFMALGVYLRTLNRPIRLFFPPNAADYQTSRTEWTNGIPNLIIDGYGARLTNCMVGGVNNFQHQPFSGNWGNFAAVNYGDVYDPALQHFGYKFATVDAGLTAITAITHAEAGNFAAGNKVLLYGLSLSTNSYPPHPEFFERNEIVSIDAGTGVINLKRPLQHSYDQNWWDFGGATDMGAPRILNLDRAGQSAAGDYLEINGLGFGTFAGHANDKCSVWGYDRAVLNECYGSWLELSVNREVEINTCKFDTVVMDKISDFITFNGGEIGNVTQGGGTNFIRYCGGVRLTGLCQLEGRNVLVNDAVLSCVAAAGNIRSISLSSAFSKVIKFTKAVIAPPVNTIISVCGGSVEQTFLIDSVVSNSKVLVLAANDAAAVVINRLDFGRVYSTGGEPGPIKKVKITKIYKADATHMAIEGVFSAVPVAGETYRADASEVILLEGLTYAGPYAGNLRRFPNTGPAGQWDGRSKYILTLTEQDFFQPASGGATNPLDVYVRGVLLRVNLRITKEYSGSSPSPVIAVKAQLPAAISYIVASAFVAGSRECLANETNGACLGDTLAPTLGAYVHTLRFSMSSGGTYVVYTDPTQLPTFEVVCEIMRL
jgi:hypothetical protein